MQSHIRTNKVDSGDVHRQRHDGPTLRQPSFNWNAPDKYVELLSFEMKVTNIPLTKKYKLNGEENVSI